MKAPFIGIMRHCINTDGKGVNTLVAFHGCPLRCKYCLNPQAINDNGILDTLTPRELLEIVAIDNLYYLATNGGITFGGGEPLLWTDFILEFRRICPPEWRINVETSLNVDIREIEKIYDVIDKFIIDIKDSNPTIYKSYTGCDNIKVIKNIKYLCNKGLQHKIHSRVPLINGFNTKDDASQTINYLKRLGISDIELFKYIIKSSVT